MPILSLQAAIGAWINAHAVWPDLPIWLYGVLALVDTHITTACVTLYLHRGQTHRSIAFAPAVEHFMRFWLWVRTAMPTKEWVAVHRCHHAHVDTEDDPHSPIFYGIWRVLFLGTALYHRAAKNDEVVAQYGKGTPEDVLERNLYDRLSTLGPVVTLVSNAWLFGTWGLAMWLVEMAWIPFFAAGVINGLGHWWGYRNYETDDAATNLVPWAILIGGEELHNNHHAAPGSARLSARWFEFDIGWAYIRLLQALGLARVRHDAFSRAASTTGELPSVATIDKRFVRDVVLPILRDERYDIDRAGQRLRRKARWLLLRQRTRLDAWQKEQLEQLLASSERLKAAYEARLRLVEIWRQAAAGDIETVRREFRDWCSRAEQSGVARLRAFAETLRGQLLLPVPA
jgi:stearoyl-CoA desaturase (delta-9 desaturase)